MKKKLFLLLNAFFCISLYSQINFEKGYFITNSGQKTECLIKNDDWDRNPTEFDYKLTETSEVNKEKVSTVKEFSIYDQSKYISATVKMDKSSEELNQLSYTRDPIFIEQQLFLKVLIEGNSNLYVYNNGQVKRFFYSKENLIEQLIYKSYLINESRVGKYSLFRQQLWNDLKCPSITNKETDKLEYNSESLVNFFTKYNKCNDSSSISESNSNFDSSFVSYANDKKKGLINLTLRPRLNYSSLNIDNANITYYKSIDFEKKATFGFGAEVEVILPYNKNKWSVFAEPAFQYFKSKNKEKVAYSSGLEQALSIDYKSIEIAFGVRHYFFLNTDSKIFIDAAYVVNTNLSSEITFKIPSGVLVNSLDIKSNNNFAFGVGYKIKNKYSFQIRQQTGRDILAKHNTWNSSYSSTSLIFGYSFSFNKKT